MEDGWALSLNAWIRNDLRSHWDLYREIPSYYTIFSAIQASMQGVPIPNDFEKLCHFYYSCEATILMREITRFGL